MNYRRGHRPTSRFGWPVVTNIWPEVLSLMDAKLYPALPSRAAVGRLAIQNFRLRSVEEYGTDIVEPPFREIIQERYGQPLTEGPVAKLPLLSIQIERTADVHQWVERLINAHLAHSISDAVRRVVAYEVPVLEPGTITGRGPTSNG